MGLAETVCDSRGERPCLDRYGRFVWWGAGNGRIWVGTAVLLGRVWGTAVPEWVRPFSLVGCGERPCLGGVRPTALYVIPGVMRQGEACSAGRKVRKIVIFPHGICTLTYREDGRSSSSGVTPH
ncbi:MAG: hypothetical protein IAE79_17000 [Anaerolinea sp.]|nr:hypothetical protein [Anaerolinea sp.]